MNALASASALPSLPRFPRLDRVSDLLGSLGSADAALSPGTMESIGAAEQVGVGAPLHAPASAPTIVRRKAVVRPRRALWWAGAGRRTAGGLPYRPCGGCQRAGAWCAAGMPVAAADLTAFSAASGGWALPGQIAIGSMADPYPAEERTAFKTRGLLAALAQAPGTRGLHISLFTRSPLLLRDLDLLMELDQHHAVTVGVLLPAVDPALRRRLEPHSPGDAMPPEELIRTLSAEGIAVRVICSPIQAGLNNAAAPLRRLFAFAHQAGAIDVLAAPRHPTDAPTPAESQGLLALFDRLRLQHGFPNQGGPGRG